MNDLDNYLDIIQEDHINEIDPLTATAILIGGVTTTAVFIKDLIEFLYGISKLKKETQINVSISKDINNILKNEKPWVVYELEDKVPNAFAPGGNSIFITSKLKELLNKREMRAVLLHEIYHNKSKHVYKDLAAKYPMLFATFSASLGVAFALQFPLILIMFVILNSTLNVLYKRIVGRWHEIKADEYAVKMGYGKDLVSALDKLENHVNKLRGTVKCEGMCRVIDRLDKSMDEHPEYKKRVEQILSKTEELKKVMITNNVSKIKDFVVGFFKK